eukprot:gene5245-5909_t
MSASSCETYAMKSQISTVCISFLTQLLDLNSLDELLDAERESYVLTNIRNEFGSKSCEDAILHVENNERKEKKSHMKLFKSNSKETNNVFGGKLSESSVKVAIRIIEHLKNYTNVEGLFRVSGNKRRQEDLKDTLNKGQSVDYANQAYSQHDLATVLKQFLAELTEPLLTDSLYICYKQVAEMDSSVSYKKRLKALQLLSVMLPPLNRIVFKKLVGLLHMVSQNPINLMTSKNLAVVIAPNVCAKTKISCLTDFSESMEPLTDILEFIIANATEVFKIPDEIFEPTKTIPKSQTDDDVLRTPRVYCKQSDVKTYQSDTLKNTNDALAELYAQVTNMPDSHPMKKRFLENFRKTCPGTPPFTPQCRRINTDSPMSQGPTPLKRRMSNDQESSQDSHRFLSTPEKKKLFTEGDLADLATPDALDDNMPHEQAKEKRKRFRRPSFGRPSFGFLSKRSTPDLRKLSKTAFGSSSKQRTRSSSSDELPGSNGEESKRRFSFTPFSERRKNQPQRALTERRSSKRSNKVSTSDSNVRLSGSESRRNNNDGDGGCQLTKNAGENQSQKTKHPELRAPLMPNIKSIGKPTTPGLATMRRETIAGQNKEQIITIDAYRPRRETLAVHRQPPAIVPLKPRRQNLFSPIGEPVLESFKPKRDSLLVHRKVQPKLESVQCVKKQIYSDTDENMPPCSPYSARRLSTGTAMMTMRTYDDDGYMRFQVDVELPYTELLGSQSPVYNESLADCCGGGEVTEDVNGLGSSSTTNSVTSDWEWMQEYGDISVLENCPGLYERCININDICCRNDRYIFAGPTLAELNERRALSPLINPDMKRLHLVATENGEDKLQLFSDNYFASRQSRPCLTELNRPIPRKVTSEDHFASITSSKLFDKQSTSLRKMLLYGVNRPGALNSGFCKVETDNDSKETVNCKPEIVNLRAVNKSPVKEENMSAEDDDIHSDSEDSEMLSNASDKDDDEYFSSDDDNIDYHDDEATPVKKLPGKKRKRSEADDWTPDPKKLLEIGRQLDRLNKIINGLRPVGHLSTTVKNKTRREKNKLASRACRLKKKAGHEANKIKLFGLNQENKHLSDVLYDIKSLLTVKPAGERIKQSFERVRQEADKVRAKQICGRTQEYVDLILKKYAARGVNVSY